MHLYLLFKIASIPASGRMQQFFPIFDYFLFENRNSHNTKSSVFRSTISIFIRTINTRFLFLFFFQLHEKERRRFMTMIFCTVSHLIRSFCGGTSTSKCQSKKYIISRMPSFVITSKINAVSQDQLGIGN